MIKKWLPLVAASLLFGCAQPTDLAQQHLDDEFPRTLNKVDQVESNKPRDYTAFAEQAEMVVSKSPSMAKIYEPLYQQLNEWALQSGDPSQLANFGVQTAQLGGGDKQGNVLFTG